MTNLIDVLWLPFLACLSMLAILSYIGMHVLKREIIFIDIALAQIAAVGTVVAHVVFESHGGSVLAHLLALAATTVAAAFFAVVRRAIVQVPLEAVIGVAYAVSAAGALFLVGVAPGGHVHIHGMLSGSILWATWSDVLWSLAAFALVGACFVFFRRPFRAISEDYEGAVAAGYRTWAWDFFFYALVGVVVSAAVRIAGVVLVFTFLIVPATLSAVFAAGWVARFFIAWGAGAVCSFLGLSFADRFDFSVGPAIALFLGVGLVVVGLLRLARAPRLVTAAAALAAAAVLGGWFVAGSSARISVPADVLGEKPSGGFISEAKPDSTVSGGDETMAQEVTAERLAEISSVEELEEIYAGAEDDEERGVVICRWIEVDARAGAKKAIEFLGGDPPLLFREEVVGKLAEATGREFPYDITKPFIDPSNVEAVTALKRTLELE
jgi:zinc/manganese transport system permease protein